MESVIKILKLRTENVYFIKRFLFKVEDSFFRLNFLPCMETFTVFLNADRQSYCHSQAIFIYFYRIYLFMIEYYKQTINFSSILYYHNCHWHWALGTKWISKIRKKKIKEKEKEIEKLYWNGFEMKAKIQILLWLNKLRLNMKNILQIIFLFYNFIWKIANKRLRKTIFIELCVEYFLFLRSITENEKSFWKGCWKELQI